MATPIGSVNIVLEEEHAEKLRDLAERAKVSPEALARSLLLSALDEADLSSLDMTLVLDGIEGAFEQAQAGLADAANGRVVPLEDL